MPNSKPVYDLEDSVGANYIEANEALSNKDFLNRIKIARKEAKESAFFLRLIYECNPSEFEKEGKHLQDEANQIKRILSTILKNSQ